MGQNCITKFPEKEYGDSKVTKDTASEVPRFLKTVRLPDVSPEVYTVLDALREYEPRTVIREKGQFANPKQINDEGTIYEGEWINNLPHGKGCMYFADGSVFDGLFFEGIPYKEGRLINSNGVYYEGDIEGGMAHGNGKIVNFLKRFSYEGEWRKNVPEGFGK